jgi:ech hydrogenase subunit F
MRLTERFFGISKTITQSLFGKPATLMYPQRPRAYSAATRGKVENEIEKCTFCRLCEKNCPTAAIGVSKEKKEWQIDSLKCCTCMRCVEMCPKKCLVMYNVYFPSVTERPAGLYLIALPVSPEVSSTEKAADQSEANES